MNLSRLTFWRKPEPEPEPRRIQIPAEHVRRVRELDGAYHAAKQDRVAHFDCWDFVASIVPEVREGSWTLEFPDALTAEVVERIK